MKTVLIIAVTIMVLVSGVSLSESKEKKKKVTSAPSSTSTVESQPVPAPKSAAPAGWTDVQTKAPQLAKVLFKIDGRDIIVRFMNVSKTSPVRTITARLR